ncbi:hypothetical protein ACH3VR_03230 [Microbacterium sp. B2969]|uniref:Mucin-associated surface protein n=1 Tax=Microbacterium alkaliflavum TaxID=3248839 RepID=A0ABW7Q555_9MICO
MIGQRFAAACAGAALAVALAGCAPQSSLDSAAGAQMQDAVVSVAQAAASGDPAGASTQLDGLQAQLDAAIHNDKVTAARAARIQTAIDAVRADLQALLAPPPAPEPSATPAVTQPSGTDDGGGDKGGGSDNSGPGNNNGNGNGSNGKGKSGKD